ncbi:MAG: hypothetical protein PHR56_05595, partial [Dehalococcoidales bacterium]|nr:hypothetical protein [Dehalococcoidales bacterium]
YHEAGHALIARMLPNADPVHKISIVARGMSLGHTRQLPVEDRYLVSRSQFRDMLATLLGGHTAEELTFKEVTTGASDDIKRATDWAHRMVTDYGMSEILGPRTFGDKQELVFLGREISEQKDYGEKTANIIDEEINKLIIEARETARRILTENSAKLKTLAEALIAKETIEGAELDTLFGDGPAKPAAPHPKPTDAPATIEPQSQAETAGTPKKAPVPKLIPEQRPAAQS